MGKGGHTKSRYPTLHDFSEQPAGVHFPRFPLLIQCIFLMGIKINTEIDQTYGMGQGSCHSRACHLVSRGKQYKH